MVNLHDFSSGQLTLQYAKKIVKGNVILKETNFTNLFKHVQKPYITVENIDCIMNEWTNEKYIAWVEYAAAASTWHRVMKKVETTSHTMVHKVQRKMQHINSQILSKIRCHRRRHISRHSNSFSSDSRRLRIFFFQYFWLCVRGKSYKMTEPKVACNVRILKKNGKNGASI